MTSLRRTALACAISLVLGGQGSIAQSAVTPTDAIEAQPLSTALSTFARNSGLQLIYVSDIAQGVQSPGARQGLTTEETLRELLRGTDLSFEFLNERTVQIRGGGAATLSLDDGHDANGAGPGAGITFPLAGEKDTATAEQSDTTTSSQEEVEKDSESNEFARNAEFTRERVAIPEVLVKGSRATNADIRRTEDDVQPYIVFGADEIAHSNSTTVEDFLRTRLPMNAQQSGLNQLPLGGVNEGRINLRGMGTDQTLVLVDGRRIPNVGVGLSSGFGQPNINGIPPSAIERIEVLPATASGIYGGSATGGVVNIILKRDYSGLELQGTLGNTFDNDAGRVDLSASGGFAVEGGRTRIMLSAAYTDQEELVPSDRDFLGRGRALTLLHDSGQLAPGFSPPVAYAPNVCSADLLFFPGFGTFGSCNAVPLVLDDGTPLSSPITHVSRGYAGPSGDGGDGLVANAGQYDIDAPVNSANLLMEFEREFASIDVRRNFGHGFEAFVVAAADRNRDRGRNDQTLQVTLTGDHPDNPFQQDIAVALNVPNLPSFGERETDNLRVLGGGIMRLPHDWTMSLEYSWGRSKSTSEGPIGLTLDAGGEEYLQSVALRDPNVFALELAPFVSSSFLTSGPFESVSRDTTLRFSGPTIGLPAGPMMLSGLLERREAHVEPGFTDGFFGGADWFPEKSQDATSLYFEARAPLLSSQRTSVFGQELELLAALRRDEYQSNAPAGSAAVNLPSRDSPLPSINYVTNQVESTDYIVGLRYAPFRDLAFRASFGTGFLPPNLGQITPTSSVVTFPAGLTDPQRGGTSVEPPFTIVGGGDTDIQPEESESLTYGLIFTPRFLDGLRLSIDYTRIEKTSEIGSAALQFWIDNEDQYGRITRGPNLPGDSPGWPGPIVSIDDRLINFASSNIEAYDFQFDFENETARFGAWSFYLVATMQSERQIQVRPDQAPFDSVGFFDGPLEWRGNGGVTWSRGPWTAGWNTQYFDSYSIEFADPSAAFFSPIVVARQGTDRIPSQTYHDVFASYRIDKDKGDSSSWLSGTEVAFGIQNLFDERPPTIAETSNISAGYSTYGDPRLRRFTLTVRKRFGS